MEFVMTEGKGSDGKSTVLFLCTHNAGARRWRWDSSPTSPATGRLPGRATPNRVPTSTLHACPLLPGRRYEEWVLPDPAGQTVDAVRPIRDDIEERLRRLLADLNVATSA